MNNIPDNLSNYLLHQRWCNFKSEIQNNQIKNISLNQTTYDNDNKLLIIGNVEFINQENKYFLMPLSKNNNPLPSQTIKINNQHYSDATQCADFWSSLINHLQQNQNTITFPNGWQLKYHINHDNTKINDNLHSISKPLNIEQSNTTIVVGNKEIAFKLERILSFSSQNNPEIEMNEKLMRENCSVMPKTYGYLTISNSSGQHSSSGIIQEFIINKGDMWNHSLEYLKNKLNTEYPYKNTLTSGNCPEFINLFSILSQKTAEMSKCLSKPDNNHQFTPKIVDDNFIHYYQKQLSVLLYQSHNYIKQNIQNLPNSTQKIANKLLKSWNTSTNNFILSQINKIKNSDNKGYICRVHGDFHLGQIMITHDEDLRIIDFAGEPGLPIEQRKEKHIYMRDYAGMYRSIKGYLEAVAIEEFTSQATTKEEQKHRKQYAEKALKPLINEASHLFLGKHSLDNPWLKLEILRKNLYEINYEVCNRPKMAHIPINGLNLLLNNHQPQISKKLSR